MKGIAEMRPYRVGVVAKAGPSESRLNKEFT